MSKKLMLCAALIAAFVVALSATAVAGTTSPITYTGQGMGDNGPTTQICTPGDNGGITGNVSGNYLLWVLPGVPDTATNVTLHMPPPVGDVVMQLNGNWKAITPLFSRADLIAFPVTATWDGGGSANNLTVSHGCSQAKLTGTLATTIVGDTALGSKVHDTVQFTPAVGSSVADMTGDGATVTYHFYSGKCGDNSNEISSETVAADQPSSDTAALAAGDYHYTVGYSGNSKYNPIAVGDYCEPLTINKGKLVLSTTLHGINGVHGDVTNTGQPLGSTVHDTATVTGAVDGFPIGAISFTRNGFHVDNADPAETGFAASTVESDQLHAGSYTYKAHIDETSNYEVADSANEPLTINQATLGITTDIHNAAHSIITTAFTNAVVHDTATVTGAVSGFPIAVSFTLNGNPVASNATADPVATVTARSVDSAPLANGNYIYRASVDDPAGSEFDDYAYALSTEEPLKVSPPTAWCSPGYWKNASDASWAKLAIQGVTTAAQGKALKFNDTVSAAGFYPLLTGANAGVTIGQALGASGANTYGPAAGTYNLNPFNAVGAYLTSLIPGYAWTGTASGNCPISNGGVLTPPPTS